MKAKSSQSKNASTAVLTPIPSNLTTPPTTTVAAPPVQTRSALLPFEKIHWTDFERLCLRLAEREADVEGCRLYGIPGQDQSGIDLFARRKTDGGYNVYQCKRVKVFGPANIRKAVNLFIKEKRWAKKGTRFVLCATVSFADKNLADTIESCRELLAKAEIAFGDWDVEELSRKLKNHPDIVDDFFGRAWVEAFCDKDKAAQLGTRLDAGQVKEFRQRMLRFYEEVFNANDPSLPSSFPNTGTVQSLPIQNRYVMPDVFEERQLYLAQPQIVIPLMASTSSSLDGGLNATAAREDLLDAPANRRPLTRGKLSLRRPAQTIRDYRQRQDIDIWVASNERTILLGGPGSGKSTFLRFLAMDLLQEAPLMVSIARKWGTFLPLWVPFGWWTKRILDDENHSSLREMLQAWLVQRSEAGLWPLVERALDDNRLLLFVDGLDEWSSEDAANIALEDLQVFVGLRKVPAIVTSRPQGYRRLGLPGSNWDVAELAGFTNTQQRRLAHIWFAHRLRTASSKALPADEITRLAAQEADAFMADLHRTPDIRELSEVPLLLSLFISYKFANVSLPLDQSRFTVYDSLITYLIEKHPQKRRTAARLTKPETGFSDKKMKRIMGYLAYIMHERFPTGFMPRGEALSVIEEYLTDPKGEFALSKLVAEEESSKVLEILENTLGLLAWKTQQDIGFFHRVFQEYLAAFYISTLPMEHQLEVIRKHRTDVQWRDVILGLCFYTNRSDVVDDFLRVIEARP